MLSLSLSLSLIFVCQPLEGEGGGREIENNSRNTNDLVRKGSRSISSWQYPDNDCWSANQQRGFFLFMAVVVMVFVAVVAACPLECVLVMVRIQDTMGYKEELSSVLVSGLVVEFGHGQNVTQTTRQDEQN